MMEYSVLFKNSASECNDSLLSYCRAQPVLFKNIASECNESLLSYCRTQPVLFKNIRHQDVQKARIVLTATV